MKKLLIFILLGVAGWYGWNHYPELMNKQPGHEAVIANQTGHTMTRVRLTVDGQTFVKESLPDGASHSIDFRVANDSEFHLVWQWSDVPGEYQWRGGRVPKGPMVQRHMVTVDGASEVIYQTRHKQ